MAKQKQHPLTKGILAGEIRALAKGITLAESDLEKDRLEAEQLLTEIMPHTGKAHRVGLSGMPGLGKSAVIEKVGLHCIAKGLNGAVLAVDPTSALAGGSILGDKARMEELSRHDNAVIRPSPSGNQGGGVAR